MTDLSFEVDPENLLREAFEKRNEELVKINDTSILDKNELKEAKKSLVKHFPRLERSRIDPPIPTQIYSLVSFIPAKIVCPDCSKEVSPKYGIYGLIKNRGNYADQGSADKQIETILKQVDSDHKIHIALTGYWCPITEEDMAYSTDEVQVQEQAEKIVLEKKREEAKKDAERARSIEEREKELKEDVEKDIDVEGLDYYIEQRVKAGTLRYKIEQIEETKKNIISKLKNVNKILLDIDTKYPNYQIDYKKKYYESRRKVGIPDDAPDPTCLVYSRPQFNRVPIKSNEELKEELDKPISENISQNIQEEN